MKKAQNVKVVQDPEKPIATEIIAESIQTIAEGMRTLTSGRLNNRALLTLIKDACPARISFQDIRMVLVAIESLDKMFLRK